MQSEDVPRSGWQQNHRTRQSAPSSGGFFNQRVSLATTCLALWHLLWQQLSVSGKNLPGAVASTLATTCLRWQLPCALCHLPVGHQEGSPLVASLLSNTPFYLLPYKRIRPGEKKNKFWQQHNFLRNKNKATTFYYEQPRPLSCRGK